MEGRLSTCRIMEFRSSSDHRSSRNCVCRIRAPNPGGQDIDTRGEDSDLCSKVGERCDDIVRVNCADGVCSGDTGRRVIGSISRVVSTGDQQRINNKAGRDFFLSELTRQP